MAAGLLPYFLAYHRSRVCLRKVVIGSMLASLQMSSLFMWSMFVLLPLAHRSILVREVVGLHIFYINLINNFSYLFRVFLDLCLCCVSSLTLLLLSASPERGRHIAAISSFVASVDLLLGLPRLRFFGFLAPLSPASFSQHAVERGSSVEECRTRNQHNPG